MHGKFVTGVTVTDLGTKTPYLEGSTITVTNPGSSAATLQFGDASTGPFSTGKQPDGSTAVCAAGGAIDVVVSGRYAALEGGSGQLQLLAN
jgi:hypothetical protein